MRLDRLELNNFRSYKKKMFKFGDLTVLYGPNGVGKSNLLEAIYLLSSGNSVRARVTEEMINWEAEIAQVTGIVSNRIVGNQDVSEESAEEYVSLTVVLTKGKYLGKRTQKRRYLVDGAGRTKAKFVGRLPAVLFRPEDLRLIEGSPGRRRQFLDESISQTSQEYSKALTAYEGAIRRRNKILDAIREGGANRTQLAFWDATVIKNGNILTDYRREFCEYLSGRSSSFGEYLVEYDASTISPARLKQYESEEVAAGYTLVGPHKDDFIVLSTNKQAPNNKQIQNSNHQMGREKDLHKYGSRGEQRLGVLFLKLGTLSYAEEKSGVKPILLLDDIFSELDIDHREEVVRMTKDRQTILSTAEEDATQLLSDADIIRL